MFVEKLKSSTKFQIDRVRRFFVNKKYTRYLCLKNIEVLAAEESQIFRLNGNHRVLYIGLKYDYLDASRGLSYEEYNFFHTLLNIYELDLLRFEFYECYVKYGREKACSILKEIVLTYKIDTIFITLFEDYFEHSDLKYFRDSLGIDLVLWLFDDDKRYHKTKALVDCSSKAVTTIAERHHKRLEMGLNSVLCQFSANHSIYRKMDLTKDIDVSFVGQCFEDRKNYIDYLLKEGINVKAWGNGWGTGRLGQSELIEVYNRSKIVLNFSAAFGNPDLRFVKGRIFEITATGAFLLTEKTDELDLYLSIGTECDIFDNKEELLSKINYYLQEEKERENIAMNGYNRTLSDYTYDKALRKIIN
ncbi:CgeB family protein [Endozoicomonas elysicola]|nr:glycosyltransferase [Endozoicomonas elysicola]